MKTQVGGGRGGRGAGEGRTPWLQQELLPLQRHKRSGQRSPSLEGPVHGVSDCVSSPIKFNSLRPCHLLQRNLVQSALWPFNLLNPEGTSGRGFLREATGTFRANREFQVPLCLGPGGGRWAGQAARPPAAQRDVPFQGGPGPIWGWVLKTSRWPHAETAPHVSGIFHSLLIVLTWPPAPAHPGALSRSLAPSP